MAGTDLRELLATMRPRLHDGIYVWASVQHPPPPSAIVSVVEDEGLTVVLPLHDAVAAGIAHEFPCAWITLEVVSALEAVGLTAAFAEAFTAVGISANVVAGFYHDHIFVPHERGADAMSALAALSARWASASQPGG